MPKLRDEPISADDLTEYLATQSDFALELFVYNEAKRRKLRAVHGGMYDDPLTDKPRQFDVRAFAARNDRRIDLAIECKSLKPSYPLLLVQIPRAKEESGHDLINSYQDDVSATLRGKAPPTHIIHVLKRDSIYREGDMVAKKMAQVGRTEGQQLLVSSDAEVYDKWSQALASAGELVFAAAERARREGVQSVYTFVWPILVVPDGTLWAADYAEDGSLSTPPRPIADGLLFVDREYTKPYYPVTRLSHLYVCTKSQIAYLLREIADGGSVWENVFPPPRTEQTLS